MRERAERGARTNRIEDEAGRSVLPKRQRGPGDGRQRGRRVTSGQRFEGRDDTRRSATLKNNSENSRHNDGAAKPQVPRVEMQSFTRSAARLSLTITNLETAAD